MQFLKPLPSEKEKKKSFDPPPCLLLLAKRKKNKKEFSPSMSPRSDTLTIQKSRSVSPLFVTRLKVTGILETRPKRHPKKYGLPSLLNCLKP